MPDWDWMQWKDVVDAPMSVEVWEWPYRVQDFLVFICCPVRLFGRIGLVGHSRS